MATSFTPLTTATVPTTSAPAGQGKPVTILSQSQAGSLCSPLFKQVKKTNPSGLAAPTPVHPPASSPGFNALATSRPESQPQITFQRQGDQITHIRIQCSCGQVIELNCEY